MSTTGTLSRFSALPPVQPLLDVIGAGLEIPVVPSGTCRLVHLDYAASAPALRSVADAVTGFLPFYASVHRGAGFNSVVSSAGLEAARVTVARFVGARPDDTVQFTRNTTDSLNLLSRILPDSTTVLTLDIEHHANLLPWRSSPGGVVRHLVTPTRAADIPAVFAAALAEVTTEHAVVAVTGASNVTGEILPLAEIGAVARRAGARFVVDGAQLVPHRAVDIAELGIDYLAFSGHKLYAPYGAGVLVGRSDWLDAGAPYLAGGGAVRNVTLDEVDWNEGVSRHEAGTPNVVGAVAIAAACDALATIPAEERAEHDRELVAYALERLDGVPGVDGVLSAFDDTDPADRVGILTLRLARRADDVAAVLSAEHGIATRDGAFCAHPLMRRLAGLPADAPSVPNAVRVSFGVGSTADDIDALVDALTEIGTTGQRVSYVLRHGRVVPEHDTRAGLFLD